MKILLKLILGCLLVVGCASENQEQVANVEGNGGLLSNTPIGDYELLFIGNSHSSANGLPTLVTKLIERGMPGKTAHSALAPGWMFLADRIADPGTLQALTGRAWTHVFLQAQKYSTTGLYWYPTDAAETWIRRVRKQEATPILFPEWPRRGNTEEGLRIHELHQSIAAKEPACVAPVGLAWDEAIVRYPGLALHAPDGNHSNLNGALLTAFVFYQVITELNAEDLPYIEEIDVEANIQRQLREVASFIVESYPPCP